MQSVPPDPGELMSRASVIDAYRRAAAIARAQGVRVDFHPGWNVRGRDGLDPKAIVEHDTSDGARLSRTRMLDILSNGHGSMSGNAIANDAVLADGTVVVIASGLAWHAGASAWDGLTSLNRWSLGTEYQRFIGDPLSDSQLRSGRIWTRARMDAFAIPSRRVCEHSETSVPAGRKVDRSVRPGTRLSGADWRRQITTGATPPAPTPPAPPEEDDDMPDERWFVEDYRPSIVREIVRSPEFRDAVEVAVWAGRTYSDPTGGPHRHPIFMLRASYANSHDAVKAARELAGELDKIAGASGVPQADVAKVVDALLAETAARLAGD
jgi:hypothetical protein